MRSFLIFLLTLIVPFFQGFAQHTSFHLTLKWSASAGIRTPESALFDPEKKFIYVSNINGDATAKDGNGFISLLDMNGHIHQLHWTDGLNAPKGLAFFGNKLYVADIDQLVIIDRNTGKIIDRITVPGASFLNDVATDEHGNVYVSDTRQAKVFRYANGRMTTFLEGDQMQGANGLFVWKGKLWILTHHGLFTDDLNTHRLELFSDEVKDGDGIWNINDQDLIVSQWVGNVYVMDNKGHATKILDTRDQHKNTADISYIPSMHLLLVPTFMGNSVDAYVLSTQ
ncbi:MAG: ATP/GTP-binding protein [Thermoflavifilum sp.]|nr:ATP/GTP-binding protein [Thermoflavifilum sp.]